MKIKQIEYSYGDKSSGWFKARAEVVEGEDLEAEVRALKEFVRNASKD